VTRSDEEAEEGQDTQGTTQEACMRITRVLLSSLPLAQFPWLVSSSCARPLSLQRKRREEEYIELLDYCMTASQSRS
jgi:hypothetical protein